MSEDFGITRKKQKLSLGNPLIHVRRHQWRHLLIQLYRSI